MKKTYTFDRSNIFRLPDPGIPLLYRVNRCADPSNLMPMHWGSYNPSNRFSFPGSEVCYLSSSLASISEATPWRNFFSGGTRVPLSENDLKDYYVSFIRPRFPLRLLDFTSDYERYGANGSIAHGDDYEEPRNFATQVQRHCDVDGILYTSKFNSDALNVVLYERCKMHFDESSYIYNERLVDTIRPMQEVLGERLGLRFLF